MKQLIWFWSKRCLVTATVLFGLLIAALILCVVVEKYRFAQLNRTHERPLQVDPKDPVLNNAHYLLDQLRPLPGNNKLLFVIMPSFGNAWLAISIAEASNKGIGEAIVATSDGNIISDRTFELSSGVLHHFLDRWDELTEGYPGEGRVWADGNPLAFERSKGARITSGVGNSPCHYTAMADWAAQELSKDVPELQPFRDPWLPKMLAGKTCNRSLFDLN